MIRPAVPGDKMAVIALMREFFYAAGFDRADGPTGFSIKPEAAYAARLFDHHLNDENACCLIFESDGAARGVLMAVAQDHQFGQVKVADEVMWWITPNFRGRAHFKMVEAYKDWARQKGCAVAGMSRFESNPRVGAIYERAGGRAIETKYLFKL